jgi:hypothetical protein
MFDHYSFQTTDTPDKPVLFSLLFANLRNGSSGWNIAMQEAMVPAFDRSLDRQILL